MADFARVSLSTVERVERGDKVSVEALDRIAQALGYERGAFTTARLPIGPEKAAEQIVETYGHLEPVPVSPMKTHKAVREAARCQAYLIHRPDVPDAYDDHIANLGEWLDLASLILSDIVEDPTPSERGRRDLYNDILKCVAELDRRGLTVLSGVMEAPQPGLSDWKVAIISVTPRLTDPGAPRRPAMSWSTAVALLCPRTGRLRYAATATAADDSPHVHHEPCSFGAQGCHRKSARRLC